MTSVEVFYPHGSGVRAWEAAYTDGLVPDFWPYGLHRIRSSPQTRPSYAEADPLTMASAFRALRRRLSSDQEQIAVSWDEDTAIRLFMQKPQARKYAGVIWTTDRVIRDELVLKDHLLRRILPHFDGLWVLSRAQIGVLTDWLGNDSPPIHFLRFGIDETFFSSWTYPASPMVLSVGRDRDRDARTLFEALEEVKRVRPDARVAVQSSSASALPTGVEALPMMPHDDLRTLYRAASVVAVATRPNVHVSGMTVALESMATARPVVITETEGMRDYVEDGATGLLVEPGDSKSMASKVLELLGDPERSAEMGQQGRLRIEEKHRTATMAADISSILVGNLRERPLSS